MATKILMNVCDGGECRIAVVDNGILQEYFVDRPSQLTHVGDVYRAVISNVESAIQAAFVDIGYKKNSFLHVSDVISAYSPSTRLTDLYGRSQVEIIPVEQIDFSAAPMREVELDDDDEDSGELQEQQPEQGDDIEAAPIAPKSDYFQTRDEAAILRTVAVERHASGEDGSESGRDDAYNQSGTDSYEQFGGNGGQHQHSGEHEELGGEHGIHAEPQHAQPLSPEEEEEKRREEMRRRRGARRRGGRDDRDGPEDRGGQRDQGRPRHSKPVGITQVAAKLTNGEEHAGQPKRDAAPKVAPVSVPRAPVVHAGPPPVEVTSSSSARVKLAPKPKPEAVKLEAFEPAPVEHVLPVASKPVIVEVVAARSSARFKLPGAKKPAVTEIAGTTEAPEAPEEPRRVSHDQSGGGTIEGSFDPLCSSFDGESVGPDMPHGFANGKPARFLRRGPLPKLQSLLNRGQEVLVQVTRAAQGGKGPSVTTYISLPGRYMVLMPNTSKCGVSRKISDPKTRNELRKALRRLRIPEGMGVIIRTAAAGRPIEELQRDLNYLLKLWNGILADINSGERGPSCAYRDSDPAVRTVRDYFTRDISEIVIDDVEVYERVMAFFDDLMPDYRNRVRLYEGGVPLFVREGVEPQIEHIFDKKVPLPSGGYLYIEQTEALVAIDVNSGRFTSESSSEETAYKTNMEAVPEIVRQLRLRDLGGIVVGDFIDMMESRHRRDVEECLKDELRKGRARIKVATTSPFGLIEMTRQRVRPSIRVYTYDECPTCGGFGHVMSAETQALRLLRAVRMALASDDSTGCVVSAPAGVLSYLHSHLRGDLSKIEAQFAKPVTFEWDPMLETEELRLFYLNDRGDRTTFNLAGEMNRFASQRQLIGFDDGAGRRRRKRRRGDVGGGEGADGDGAVVDAPRQQEEARDDRGRDLVSDAIPLRGRGDRGDGRGEGRSEGRGERRGSRDRRDGRGERREGSGGGNDRRRGGDRERDRRGRPDRAQHGGPRPPQGEFGHDGPQQHGGPEMHAPEFTGGPDAAPMPHDGMPHGEANAEGRPMGQDADGQRRRRGRRGGRRHRRDRDGAPQQGGPIQQGDNSHAGQVYAGDQQGQPEYQDQGGYADQQAAGHQYDQQHAPQQEYQPEYQQEQPVEAAPAEVADEGVKTTSRRKAAPRTPKKVTKKVAVKAASAKVVPAKAAPAKTAIAKPATTKKTATKKAVVKKVATARVAKAAKK